MFPSRLERSLTVEKMLN